MQQIVRYLLIIAVLFFFGLRPVHAADSKTDYKAEYFLEKTDTGILSKVKLTIDITNLKTEQYVKKISLFFPKSFTINNLKATDDIGPVYPDVASDRTRTKIDLEFNDPKVGKNTTNSFSVQFDQDNLFKTNGNVWEVILPTISDESRTNYTIQVHLPEFSDKKIAIAKPKPDSIENNTITWTNPKEKTIYAVFGDEQYYAMKLLYHLENPKLVPVYTDVAFPPDTLYQKVYIDDISPKPDEVFTDDDGNLMGRYILAPKQTISITYKGKALLTTQPREEIIPVIRQQIQSQKKYLLQPQPYWKIDNFETDNFNSPEDIYNYVDKKLTYNYAKVNKDTKRLGATEALKNPTQAVCTEFSDVYIALARQKHFLTREIQGYGFSNDDTLRPLSAVSDVLHSWVEYYDEESELWIPIDPTWGNTSGIDYYSSFDLNHIVFAIHGKEDDYPYPAGSYKTEDSKDVEISAISDKPNERTSIHLEQPGIPSKITDNQIYTAKLNIINDGNTYAWDLPVTIQADNIQLSQSKTIIPMLAPFEKKTIEFKFKSSSKNLQKEANLSVFIGDNKVYATHMTILPFIYTIILFAGVIVGALIVCITSFLLVKNIIFKH